MNNPTPNIRYYARLDYDKASKKTPKYVITQQAGFYPCMQELVGRNGKISMFLLSSRESGCKKDNAPAMRLQAKGGLNFTGLKDYFVEGGMSGFAYGYPLATETYSKKKKENPFYKFKDDGFLFIVHYDKDTPDGVIKPSCFELIVLEGAKVLISSYCKQLMMKGFDEALKSLREQAQNEFVL